MNLDTKERVFQKALMHDAKARCSYLIWAFDFFFGATSKRKEAA